VPLDRSRGPCNLAVVPSSTRAGPLSDRTGQLVDPLSNHTGWLIDGLCAPLTGFKSGRPVYNLVEWLTNGSAVTYTLPTDAAFVWYVPY